MWHKSVEVTPAAEYNDRYSQMTEQKRPVLTLKRKTEGTTPVRSRKTIINVTTPPKWKLSHKKLRRALKAITRSESYLCAMKAGACRYDTQGYVTEYISQEEEAYAAERLAKIRRQNRRKAELRAVLDE